MAASTDQILQEVRRNTAEIERLAIKLEAAVNSMKPTLQREQKNVSIPDDTKE